MRLFNEFRMKYRKDLVSFRHSRVSIDTLMNQYGNTLTRASIIELHRQYRQYRMEKYNMNTTRICIDKEIMCENLEEPER